tara:strand:- start:747 stop:1799 length:1053 start_codon:yes stop_codon:yes gene_type:complete
MKKRILITGGAGFIGSNFVHFCIQNGYKVLNYDILTYAGNLSNLEKIENNSNYSFVRGDICDRNLLNKIVNKFEPNFIVNFAAESHVDRSIDSPDSFINTNINGTYELLKISLNYYLKIKKNNFKFLHVSTDEVFGSLKDEGLFNEETPYNPSSPYSASKASSDHLVRAWFSTYSLPILITNCSNNYGPFQFPEKLIPLMITNCLDNKKLPIYGNGSNVRDWLFVEDHCNAISSVLNNGEIGSTYNIGGNEEKTNLEIVNLICEILDEIYPSKKLKSYKELITFVEDRPGHDYRYAIDSTKIKRECGWSPKETFSSGLKKTIRWYVGNKLWVENIKSNKYNLERLGLNKS